MLTTAQIAVMEHVAHAGAASAVRLGQLGLSTGVAERLVRKRYLSAQFRRVNGKTVLVYMPTNAGVIELRKTEEGKANPPPIPPPKPKKPPKKKVKGGFPSVGSSLRGRPVVGQSYSAEVARDIVIHKWNSRAGLGKAGRKPGRGTITRVRDGYTVDVDALRMRSKRRFLAFVDAEFGPLSAVRDEFIVEISNFFEITTL